MKKYTHAGQRLLPGLPLAPREPGAASTRGAASERSRAAVTELSSMTSKRANGAKPRNSFTGLHWMAAGMFLAGSAELLLFRPRDRSPSRLARWAPLLTAPIAGSSQIAMALRPEPATRRLARLANGLALGAAAIGLGATLYEVLHGPARHRLEAWRNPTAVAPLTFGATGILGMLLDREEEEAARQQRMDRRRRFVERIFPRRKLRVERIVVHV
jgi:hypothetical protein